MVAMTFVHGRSPLGYLRRLRASIIVIPLLTLAALTVTGRRSQFDGAFINPESRAELEPVLPKLWIATVIALLAIRLFVSPTALRPVRYVLICAAYLLALATCMASLIFTLAGGAATWAVAGYALAIAAVTVVSLNRFAHDVSPHWG